MEKNLFKMEVNFGNEWSSDNKNKSTQKVSTEIKSPKKHQLHFAKEKRRGKVVTIVKPFCLEKKDLQVLLKIIKKKLGTGGTLKENTLEFQGELEEQLKIILEKFEYRFKL
jgi:translation initiation factor 1